MLITLYNSYILVGGNFLITFTLSFPFLSWSNWWKTEDADEEEAFEEDLNKEGELLKYPEELLGESSQRLKLKPDLLEVDLLETPDELVDVSSLQETSLVVEDDEGERPLGSA